MRTLRRRTDKAFTLIELLIVIGIITVLAATFIPNFIGFDSEARAVATKVNMDSINTRIILFRSKEGRYPESLGDLLTTYYSDAGIKKPYLNRIPTEMITDKRGKSNYIDLSAGEPFTNEGGWVYVKDQAEVKVNYDVALSSKWGEYEGQNPAKW